MVDEHIDVSPIQAERMVFAFINRFNSDDEFKDRMLLRYGAEQAEEKILSNIEKINSNFRRIKNPTSLLHSYSSWANGATQTQMRDELPVSLRTINTWVAWFKDIPQREVELDKVGFHYHQMEDYGIAWDKYEEVMRLVEEYSVQENVELTPRMAKWAWRLQQIKNPTFDRNKAKEFMKRFVEAEQSRVLGIINKGGLNKVSQDLQFELSRWQTTPIGRTHNES